MFRKWLDRLRARSASDSSAAEDARRAQESAEARWVDSASGRTLGVHGDAGTTLRDPDTPERR